MADRVHVLSKYQVAEGILGSEMWDWHSDGTTRDHNKIICPQINTNNLGMLSAGFSGVAREDSATLLDNAIAMLEELSDVNCSATVRGHSNIM